MGVRGKEREGADEDGTDERLVGGWGPVGLEQPANEEPSEASIHLEHGPLLLP